MARSNPYHLIIDGEIQTAVRIVASAPMPGLTFYGVTETNEHVNFGALTVDKLEIPQGRNFIFLYYDFAGDDNAQLPAVTVIFADSSIPRGTML